ncbi:MAG: hypothetical protein WCG80_02460 [Spirochaetales bacterium]
MRPTPASLALLALVSLAGVPAIAVDFWTTREIAEIDGYSELDGVIQLKFKDAVSAKPVQNLRLTLDDGTTLRGNADGIVEFPLEEIADISDLDLPFNIAAPGYVDYRDVLRIQAGTIMTKRFVISPAIPPNQARFVVEWDRRPADVDAVLRGPSFEVSYHTMKAVNGKAALDRDARNGYGPETLTLLNIQPSAEYVFSIVNYSKEAALAGVKISLYINSTLARVQFLPRLTDTKVDVVRIRAGQVEYLVR